MPNTSRNRYNPSSEDSADFLPTYNVHGQLTGARMRQAYVTEDEEESYHAFTDQARDEQGYAEPDEHLQWYGIEFTPMLIATMFCAVFGLWAIWAALH